MIVVEVPVVVVVTVEVEDVVVLLKTAVVGSSVAIVELSVVSPGTVSDMKSVVVGVVDVVVVDSTVVF